MRKNGFFAMMTRMRNITRWGLMRNNITENLTEHSYDTAVTAHALAVIGKEKFGKDIDPGSHALFNKVNIAGVLDGVGQIHFTMSGAFVAMDLSPVSVRRTAGTIDRFFSCNAVVERSESSQRFDHGSGHVGSHGRPVQKRLVLILQQLFIAVFRSEIRQ